jgi:hypothetical protein
LRIYFLFDRSLLTKLSRCAWKLLNLYLIQGAAYNDTKAGVAVAVQSFGPRLVDLRLGERHSGFNVYCGNAIWP